ncbi:uncharacterized protein LOC121306716 isoform X2 [Polyodon spathula]|uniref:uncharacterized protein LOC121306716 isoform X2 n=1 Tax=Polyodon spathula TaxID=7913 RepID=UPI001B7DCC78|nr:uncharacterized protein LOC121306716 isoform X2 [Polyodon spathula]
MVLERCGVLQGLLSQDPGQVMGVVEALVCELHQDKEGLIESILRDPSSQDYMRALCRLLTSTDTRLCSNAAYILGSIAESETGTQQLVSLGGAGDWDSWDLLGTLTSLLRWDDAEAVMNAAGTIGTLAESSEGRQWILGDQGFVEMVDSVTSLLDARSEWTVSNAALVLARLSMCESGCRRLLEHPNSARIISKLIASLRGDEAGCGMNAAFALGRLCDTDLGRQQILSMAEAPGMVASLGAMLAQPDAGGSKNACFALSCLATEAEGHSHVLQSSAFPQLLNSLQRLLQVEDQDSAWFAAMTVKVLASQPSGVLKLREDRKLEELLKSLVCSKTAGKELLEEVSLTLSKLQRLPKPLPPRTELLDSGSILVSWETCTPGNGLEVTYRCLYSPARASKQQQQPPLNPPAKESPDCSDRTRKPRGTGAPHKEPPRAPKAHLALSKGCCRVWDSDSTGGSRARHRRPSTPSQRTDGSKSSAQCVEAVPKTVPTGRPQQSDQRGLSPMSSGTDPCAREQGGGHGPSMRRQPCTQVVLNTVSDYDVGEPLFSRVQPSEGVTSAPIRLPGKPPSSSSPTERPRGRPALLLERRAKTESELLPRRGGRRREEQTRQEGAAGRRGSLLLDDSLRGSQSLSAVHIPGKESPFQLKHFQRGEAHTQLLSTKERLLSSDLLLRMNCVMQERSQQRQAQSLSLSAGVRGPQLSPNHRTSRPPLPHAPPGLNSLLQDKANLVKRMQTLSEVARIQLDWNRHHRTPVRLPARLGQGGSFVLTPVTGIEFGVWGHCPKPR